MHGAYSERQFTNSMKGRLRFLAVLVSSASLKSQITSRSSRIINKTSRSNSIQLCSSTPFHMLECLYKCLKNIPQHSACEMVFLTKFNFSNSFNIFSVCLDEIIDIQNCNFAWCFVWVSNLVADIKGGT
jgi:hypothetical protein